MMAWVKIVPLGLSYFTIWFLLGGTVWGKCRHAHVAEESMSQAFSVYGFIPIPVCPLLLVFEIKDVIL